MITQIENGSAPNPAPSSMPSLPSLAAASDYQWKCYWEAQSRIHGLTLDEMRQLYLDTVVENAAMTELYKSNLAANWALLDKTWNG